MRKHSERQIALLFVFLLGIQAAGCGKKPADTSLSPTNAAITSEETSERTQSAVSPNETVPLPADPNAVNWGAENTFLEQFLRLKTGIYDRELKPEDLQTVEELILKFPFWELPGKDALVYLTNLRTLKIAGNWSNDDSFTKILSGLTSLENLEVEYLKDVHVLSGLTGLKTLKLEILPDTDLSFLSALTNLTVLELTGIPSNADLSSLSGLTNLTSLSLSFVKEDNGVVNLSALSGLSNLETLYLTGEYGATCYIKEIGFLSGLNKLKVLSLPWVDCADLSPLFGLSTLETLELMIEPSEETKQQVWQQDKTGDIYDISALSALSGLKTLKLGANFFYVDLNALSGLTNLVTLDLGPISSVTENGKIQHYAMDLSSLSGLTSLNTLKLDWVNVNQIASIPALPNLNTLVIKRLLKLDQYGEEERLKEANVMYLPSDWRQNLEPFPNLANLTTLIIESEAPSGPEWQAEDCALFHLPGLTTLEIGERSMKAMETIVFGNNHSMVWPNLTTLVLPESTIGGQNVQERGWSAAWNACFPSLTTLTLDGFRGDLSALSGLAGLTSLTLTECGTFQGISALSNLTELEVDMAAEEIFALSNLKALTIVPSTVENDLDAGKFANLRNLVTLDLECYVKDLNILSGLPNLTTLVLGSVDSKATDIRALYNLPELNVIWPE